MRRSFQSYLLGWILTVAIFNVAVFTVPAWPTLEKYTESFFIGYAFSMVAFLGHLICACLAFKEENASKIFYNIPIIKVCFSGTVITFIAGLIIMVITPLPYWISAVACSLVLLVNVISVIKASLASELVQELDEKIKGSTQFIYTMRTSSESLFAKASSDGERAAVKKVRDAFLRSDPVSSNELLRIEYNIKDEFDRFTKLITDGQEGETLDACADNLVAMLSERASLCRATK